MATPRLFQVLSTLSPTECKAFGKFLAADYHNGKQVLRHLWEALKDSHPAFEGKAIRAEALHRSCYPGLPFQKSRITKIFSALLACAEQFIVHERLKNDALQRDLLLLDETRRRHWSVSRTRAAKRIDSFLTTQPTSAVSLRANARYAREQLQSLPKEDTADYRHAMRRYAEHLDRAYLFDRLYIEHELLNRAAVFTDRGRVEIPHLVTKLVPHLPDSVVQHPPVSGWLSLYRLLHPDTDDRGDARLAVAALPAYLDRMAIPEARELLLALINYVNGHINKTDAAYGIELMAVLFRTGVKKKLFLVNGEISVATYYNIIAVLLGVKDDIFIRWFMFSFEQYLPKAQRTEHAALARAQLFFYEGRFADCVELARNLQITHPLLHLRARELVLRALYKANSVVRFRSETRALLTWLRDRTRRKTLADRHVVMSTNFVIALRAMQNGKMDECDRIIGGEEGLNYRDWMLRECALFKKG